MKIFACLLAVLSVAISFSAPNNAIYEQRRTDYINNALTNFDRDAITIQAYEGLPLDTAALNDLINNLPIKSTVDFDIVKLVRILFLSTGQYDSLILPPLHQLPFWINKGDTLHGYWSENHMIQWMSSDWLLHEKYGWAVDSNLDKRLRHYLHLKVDYGFYEFFSSVYAPYCFAGLVNLADFAQDAEMKMLATQAAQRLLKELLLLTNDRGVFFPAAGRNYYGKYETPYGQNHNHLIYLLSGLGQTPVGASHAGGFLATSTLPVDSVISSWTPDLDLTYSIGHSLDTGFVLNSGMSPLDKVIFQWSSGAYFHPEVVQESVQLLIDSNLWHHVDFAPFVGFATLPVSTIVSLASSLSVASESSVICGQDVVIYKHHSITLSSIKDFWEGKLGYQQFPCVANVGTTAVFTASGKVEPNWGDRTATNANDNLPYVEQHHNIALLMYRPEFKPALLPYHNPEVTLHFTDADFDEVRTDSLWVLGRQGSSYVAVRKHCAGEVDSLPGCYMDKGQAWVIVVGDSVLYGGFNHFESLIQQSQFQERWYVDTTTSQYVYYAGITIDTTTIGYAWGVDTALASGIKVLSAERTLKLFPNPAKDKVKVNLSAFAGSSVKITMLNTLGQVLYSEQVQVGTTAFKDIPLSNLPRGVYTVIAEDGALRYAARMVKE